MGSFNRYYLAKNIHAVDDKVLNKMLESFEGAALKFSVDIIRDAEQRENYNHNVRRVKAEGLAEVKAGRVSVKDAAVHCYEIRNNIMAETRAKPSKPGRAVADWKKKVSPALEQLLNDKSVSQYGKKFVELSAEQNSLLYYEVIEFSAKTSARFKPLIRC